MIQTLSAELREEMADSLEKIATKYFNGEKVDIECGICRALHVEWNFRRTNDAYQTMDVLLNELHQGAGFGDYSSKRENWEPRAWMCFFLAKHLRDTAK